MRKDLGEKIRCSQKSGFDGIRISGNGTYGLKQTRECQGCRGKH